MRLRTPLLLALAIALAATAIAQAAATFPSKPVRVIVAFAPGGPNDVVVRLVTPRLSELWGQPVLIENRPGAGARSA